MGLLDFFGFRQQGNYPVFDGTDEKGTQPPAITLSLKEYGWGDKILNAIGFYNTSTSPEETKMYASFDGVEGKGRHPLPKLGWRKKPPEQAVPAPRPA
jgi:hypothetical protein